MGLSSARHCSISVLGVLSGLSRGGGRKEDGLGQLFPPHSPGVSSTITALRPANSKNYRPIDLIVQLKASNTLMFAHTHFPLLYCYFNFCPVTPAFSPFFILGGD